MTTINKQRLALAIGAPSLIFIVCTSITFSSLFKQHTDELTLAILVDMLVIAPFLYYLIIYKTTIAKTTVLRVFIVAMLLTTIILSKSNSLPLTILKTYIYPIIEILLASYVVYKFYSAKKLFNKLSPQTPDFLTQSRAVLTSLMENTKIANIVAVEIAVFYYIFRKKDRTIDNITKFTCYRENGIALVLNTFLALFLIEAVGLHFLLQLWNETVAWVLTSLSIYSCLQLYAHIKSLKARPIVITNNELHLRNGMLGGEVVLQLQNIDKVVPTNKNLPESEVVKLALIQELEKHNLAIYLKEPVSVIKAYGIKKTAKILLISIDKRQDFIAALNKRIWK